MWQVARWTFQLIECHFINCNQLGRCSSSQLIQLIFFCFIAFRWVTCCITVTKEASPITWTPLWWACREPTVPWFTANVRVLYNSQCHGSLGLLQLHLSNSINGINLFITLILLNICHLCGRENGVHFLNSRVSLTFQNFSIGVDL